MIKAHAEVDGSLTGLTFIKDDKQYIKDWQQYGSTSFAGYGAAVDLGAAYKLGRDFTLSAAVLDLGFIKWGKDNSIKGVSEFQREYDLTECMLENIVMSLRKPSKAVRFLIKTCGI